MDTAYKQMTIRRRALAQTALVTLLENLAAAEGDCGYRVVALEGTPASFGDVGLGVVDVEGRAAASVKDVAAFCLEWAT